MAAVKKKYLFFDIDGTLVAGGYSASYVPESTRLALDKLKQAGHFLALATGRSQAMAYDFMEKLDIDNMVSDGGYGLTLNGKLIRILPLDKVKACELIDECQKKGFPWGITVANEKCRYTNDERFMKHTDDTYISTIVKENLDPRSFEKIYKVCIACLPGEEKQLEKLKKLPWCRFHHEYIFVEPADKAGGIKMVMDHLGAPYEDVIVFGDNNNDLSMFTDDWFKVAMGNATDDLKAKADYITGDVDKDGIYEACEYLHLFDKVSE